MRVLFTGISGVGLKECIDNLASFLRESGQYKRSPKVMKAEKHFLPVLQGSPFFPAEYKDLKKAQQMIYALGLPKPLLRKSWAEAVRKLGLPATEEEDVFLCAHVVFHHQLTREFFSPVDLAIMKEWQPDLVVTVVDDTENCLDRLRGHEHMFSATSYAYGGMEGFNNSLSHMRLLFDWRAFEIMEAERLAADLGVKHFCIAAKHPLETVASLIFKRERPVMYVSHPISEPRRDLNAGNRESFNRFVEELERTCARLRRGVTLIEPTTIDEFRLRRITQGSGKQKQTIYLPALTERWPVPPNTMWVKPATATGNPLDPGHFFTDDLIAKYSKAKHDEESTKQKVPFDEVLLPCEIAGNLLGVLVGNITAQIDARDHKLVEQCHGLVVLRPLYQGNPSHGVEAEVRYHCELCVSGVPRGPLWVYTDRGDEFAYLCRSWIVTYLCDLLKLGQAQGTGDLEKDEGTISQACASASPTEDRKALAHDVLGKLGKHGIQLVGQRAGGPLESRPEKSSVGAQAHFIQALEAARPPYLECLEDYAKYAKDLVWTIRQGPEISLDQFIGEVLESHPQAGQTKEGG